MVRDVIKTSNLKILKRIIVSGREFELGFQNLEDLEENEKSNENREIVNLFQTFRNDPKKSRISLRSELGLPGIIFFLKKNKIKFNQTK